MILCSDYLGSSLISCENDVGSSVPTPLLSAPTGFSPVWFFPWSFNCELVTNVLSHLGQANGFSSVWVILCFSRLQAVCKCLVSFLCLEMLFISSTFAGHVGLLITH